ncbi:hypothetical protein P6U16_23705 (plasmid) [Rhizobium sp. 32-5/1]|uniref:hypothetical protein n=1 Tax=Rhizobium sp. 32-5/1 TaxID=3019602 RepID=UPI00240E70E8|nr:hypothetical protein [Rhizobium sp. 32-5/1]WEZ85968.1 hypothetical protein P6U16_23705 [Rhizobium sp. 32-5/1]
MAIDRTTSRLPFGVLFATVLLTSCGTVKEKTAPCKRPAELRSFAEDRRQDCGPMRSVNDPAAAFAAIGFR